MYVVIPHVGKSHLTRETVLSVPDHHRVVVIDASYVADLDTLAANHPAQIVYVRPKEIPTCLAKNWNLGAAAVPAGEDFWMFCASDIQFHKEAWPRIEAALENYPDAAIIKDAPTNWNVWIIRRWAWDILAPMDERYTPCGGEDDDLVMKCQAAGLKIFEFPFRVNHLEGGHATRLDIKRDLAGTDWTGRHRNLRLFKQKWGCIPSKGRDPVYKAAIAATHIRARRAEPPSEEFIAPRPGGATFPPQDGWPSPLNLNFGCGIKPIEGFVNVDAKSKFAQVRMDIVNGAWPWKPGTVDRIETYHMIEHLSKGDAMVMLERSLEALKPGGVLVIECPDLLKVSQRYARSTRLMRHVIYGQSGTEWRAHKWGYCPATMRLLLEQTGFREIKIGDGTDYHVVKLRHPCLRAEAVK